MNILDIFEECKATNKYFYRRSEPRRVYSLVTNKEIIRGAVFEITDLSLYIDEGYFLSGKVGRANLTYSQIAADDWEIWRKG